jgi:hypothetical protein
MNPSRRRLRVLAWVMVIGSSSIAVLYLVLAVVFTVGDNDKYGKVAVPGEGRVTLEEGSVVIHYEARANLGENSTIGVPADLSVRVRPIGGGELLAFEDGSHISSYQLGSLDGTSVWKAEVPASGDYAVAVSGGAGDPYPDKAVTFGPNADFGAILLRCAAIIGIGLLAAGALMLLSRSGRRPPTPATAGTPPLSEGGLEARL